MPTRAATAVRATARTTMMPFSTQATEVFALARSRRKLACARPATGQLRSRTFAASHAAGLLPLSPLQLMLPATPALCNDGTAHTRETKHGEHPRETRAEEGHIQLLAAPALLPPPTSLYRHQHSFANT